MRLALNTSAEFRILFKQSNGGSNESEVNNSCFAHHFNAASGFPFASDQAPCAPGISFWKLLDAVSVGYGDGRLRIDKLYAVCLPTPAKQSSSNYPYDPDGGGKLTSVVKTADGKVLAIYVWYAESIGGLWELSNYKVIGGPQSVKPLSAGNYVLEFAADDKPFTRFPFSVVEGKSDDPYQPAGARYFH